MSDCGCGQTERTWAGRVFGLTLRGAVSLACVAIGAVAAASEKPSGARTYEEHVRPILKAMCFHCHGEESDLRGGLDLRLVRLIQAGGESGPAIAPGDPATSLLWQRIESDEMPDGPKKLTPEQKATIRQWIEQGAATLRPEPENVEEARFSVVELGHWAYQPVGQPRVPPRPAGYRLSNPVDAFIADRLSQQQLSFSSPADRETLLRRATLDLTGVPPTPQDVTAFVADPAPDAYARVIDRLLASPRLGVRWGRHWLDVAGFAETDGGAEESQRPHAWRYRDYVVDSLNANKPIDEFLREQLAGDELIEGPPDPRNPRHLQLLAATGFLRMAPDATQTSNTLADRNAAVADSMKIVSSAILGITVGCAQCHDHKYDPIGIDDYYRFRAIFDPAFPLADWQQPGQRLVDLTPPEVRAEADRIEAEAKRRDDDLNARRNVVGQQIQDRKLADVPAAAREAARTAVLTDPHKRTPQQRELLDLYPMVKPISEIIGLLVEYDMPSYRQFEKELQEIAAFRDTKPPLTLVMVTTERPGVVPTSSVFFRGNPETPGATVAPAELAVLRQTSHDRAFAAADRAGSTTGQRTSGRRLAYARHLTDGQHPLTARVFVNRVWHHHMGRGLVATTGDFGLSGDRPSHPELLDWLADDFQRQGWDSKRLHRLIMQSTTYQQLALRRPEQDAVDPENTLWGRMNVRRLEAEAIRDSILCVADSLHEELGGPSIPVTEDGEGKAVIGRTKLRDGLPAGVEAPNSGAFRRSLFIQVQRNLPLNVLHTFDQPDLSPNCEQRGFSTVATQALWFLNDDTMLQHAERLARLLWAERDQDATRLDALFEKLFAVPPTAAEREECAAFLGVQAERFRSQGDAEWQTKLQGSPQEAEIRAWSSLCQALLASNRFLYVD